MKVGVSYHSLWLNESIINFMMSAFGKRGASKGIVFHKTSVLRKFGENNDIGGRCLDYCWKFAKKFIFNDQDNMFRAEGLHVFPVNYSGSHWVLMVVHFKSSTIYSLDGYGRTYEDLKIDVMAFLSLALFSARNTTMSQDGIQHHNIQDEFPQLGSWKYKTVDMKVNSTQDDGHNCGVWIVMYALALLLNEDLLLDPENNSPLWMVNDNINAARLCIFELILLNTQNTGS